MWALGLLGWLALNAFQLFGLRFCETLGYAVTSAVVIAVGYVLSHLILGLDKALVARWKGEIALKLLATRLLRGLES